MHKKKLLRKDGALLSAVLLSFFAVSGSRILADTAQKGDEAWQQELRKEREQKDIEFKTSATSPMAGSVRLTVSAPEKAFITIKDGSVTVQPRGGDGAVFSVFGKAGKWYWDDAAPGITCRLGERALVPGVDALVPGSLFKAGRFTLSVYPGPDTLALIVFDPQRPQLLAFEHLLYFAPDAAYAVKARLVKFPEQREVKIITTRKLEKTFYRYARVHFQLRGRDLELTALKSSLEGPDSDILFIPFKDDSNGKESYEVGRFIDAAEPAGDEFILDFNRCYNPLCNYSPAYNCPLPPLENILDVAVPAGEKAYPH
jgi:uncharacterized protein (DUF1684 family)